MTVLFLHVVLSYQTSVYKCSHPLLVRGWGELAFGQMSATPLPQLPASKIKQTSLSTILACLLAFEQ